MCYYDNGNNKNKQKGINTMSEQIMVNGEEVKPPTYEELNAQLNIEIQKALATWPEAENFLLVDMLDTNGKTREIMVVPADYDPGSDDDLRYRMSIAKASNRLASRDVLVTVETDNKRN